MLVIGSTEDDHLSAVRDAPDPTNVTELRLNMGMVNHYGHFLPNLAKMQAPGYKVAV